MLSSKNIIIGFFVIILIVLPLLTNNSSAKNKKEVNNIEVNNFTIKSVNKSKINNDKIVKELNINLTKTKINKSNNFTTHCTVTCYNPVESQCNSQPLITADMSKINMAKLKAGQIKWCAVSRDLLPYLPYGSKILIEGEGVYEVHDTMNKRFNHYIDILKHPSEQGFKKTNIKITHLG